MILEENPSDYTKRARLEKSLMQLSKITGYDIIQTNGQRVYAPPDSRNIRPPPKGCEVFIGKLCRTIYEDELIPLFEQIGPLYKFRLMLDFTYRTRGYAFATYFTPEDADQAVEKLNHFEIRRNLFIGVYKSLDNCRLFIGNIPPEKTSDEVYEALTYYTVGIVQIMMFAALGNSKMNRGFAFVEFESHRYAAMARREFTPNNLILWNRNLYVDWADPIPNVDPKIMDKVTILYLSNLPLEIKSNHVRDNICTRISTQTVIKIYKHLNYAFVHLNNRSSAEYAYQKLQNLEINNCQVGVSWARPRCYSKTVRLSKPPQHFCKSVPPTLRRMIVENRQTIMNSSSSDIALVNGNTTSSNSSETSNSNAASGGCDTPSYQNWVEVGSSQSTLVDTPSYQNWVQVGSSQSTLVDTPIYQNWVQVGSSKSTSETDATLDNTDDDTEHKSLADTQYFHNSYLDFFDSPPPKHSFQF